MLRNSVRPQLSSPLTCRVDALEYVGNSPSNKPKEALLLKKEGIYQVAFTLSDALSRSKSWIKLLSFKPTYQEMRCIHDLTYNHIMNQEKKHLRKIAPILCFSKIPTGHPNAFLEFSFILNPSPAGSLSVYFV